MLTYEDNAAIVFSASLASESERIKEDETLGHV